MWSQVKANRNISNKLARQIEGCMKREKGWLDQEHFGGALPTKAEQHFLESARRAWRSADAEGRRELLRFLREKAEIG